MSRTLETRLAKLEANMPSDLDGLTDEQLRALIDDRFAALWPNGATYAELRAYYDDLLTRANFGAYTADDLMARDGLPPKVLKGPVPPETAAGWERQAKRHRLKELRDDAFTAARASGWKSNGGQARWNDWIELPPEFVPHELQQATVDDLYG